MCNDEALNVVICSMNANIHVIVHKDLHEINLLYVKVGLNWCQSLGNSLGLWRWALF
jgi:hypothetical protein